MTIRVLLADDHPALRYGLVELLGTGGCTVVAEASGAAATRRLCRTHRPDVLLCDLGFPDGSGIDVIHDLAHDDDPVPALAYTAAVDPQTIFEVFDAGAKGYLAKTAAPAELFQALRTVADGAMWYSVEASRAIAEGLRRQSEVQLRGITGREIDILTGVRDGLTNREIAELCHLSPATVKSYTTRLLHKLGARTRAQALVRAAELGLLNPVPAARR